MIQKWLVGRGYRNFGKDPLGGGILYQKKILPAVLRPGPELEAVYLNVLHYAHGPSLRETFEVDLYVERPDGLAMKTIIYSMDADQLSDRLHDIELEMKALAVQMTGRTAEEASS